MRHDIHAPSLQVVQEGDTCTLHTSVLVQCLDSGTRNRFEFVQKIVWEQSQPIQLVESNARFLLTATANVIVLVECPTTDLHVVA